MSLFQKATFLDSVYDWHKLPEDIGMEVAIIGRSNAGKSSTLNALTQQKQLARVSKTPGRTQCINLFELDEQHRLADLPGYGFAKVPAPVQKRWTQLIERYLAERKSLKGLIVVMDIRHPLKTYDVEMIEWAVESNLPVHLLLNKADKLKYGATQKTLQQVSSKIKSYPNVSIQTISALRKTDIETLKQKILDWYQLSSL